MHRSVGGSDERENSLVVTATVRFAANSGVAERNGAFTPAHVIGSTAVFIPTAFNLTFSFTPTGGTTQSETDTAAKQNQAKGSVTCNIPAALITCISPRARSLSRALSPGSSRPQTARSKTIGYPAFEVGQSTDLRRRDCTSTLVGAG